MLDRNFLQNFDRPQDAKLLAQFIAFAPFVFQAARCLRDFGVLSELAKVRSSKPDFQPESLSGASFEELLTRINSDKGAGVKKISRYGLRVLLDGGVSSGLISEVNLNLKNKTETSASDEVPNTSADESNSDLAPGGQSDMIKYDLTQVGYFVFCDRITNINMNFTQDVCYDGLKNLKASIENEKPEGLQCFGSWSTVYEGLMHLPSEAQKSWFEFDHFFSNEAFPRVLPLIFDSDLVGLKNQEFIRIQDVGGNTGNFAIAACTFNPRVHVLMVDHPEQLKKAQSRIQNLDSEGAGTSVLMDRIQFRAMDVLDETSEFEADHDLIWMSQFLDCFSEAQILSLLKRAARALTKPNSRLLILETFTDRQKYSASKFCLDMTSLYFTCIANGNSRMYRATDFYNLIESAGLELVQEVGPVRLSHTLLICKARRFD